MHSPEFSGQCCFLACSFSHRLCVFWSFLVYLPRGKETSPLVACVRSQAACEPIVYVGSSVHRTLQTRKLEWVAISQRGVQLLTSQWGWKGAPLSWRGTWEHITGSSARTKFPRPRTSDVWQAVHQIILKFWPLHKTSCCRLKLLDQQTVSPTHPCHLRTQVCLQRLKSSRYSHDNLGRRTETSGIMDSLKESQKHVMFGPINSAGQMPSHGLKSTQCPEKKEKQSTHDLITTTEKLPSLGSTDVNWRSKHWHSVNLCTFILQSQLKEKRKEKVHLRSCNF